ncbi:MAG: tetratricopeptide repeat protein [Armatimonadota bacterium]
MTKLEQQSASLPPERLLPTVGIITALPHEFAAVQVLLGEESQEYHVPGSGAGRRYLLSSLASHHGGMHHIVSCLLPEMGNNSAAGRATLLLEHFPNVEAIIMVGIAGGIPHPEKPAEHVRLGDLVISDRLGVVQYDFVKEGYDFNTKERWVEVRSSPRPPSALLLESVTLLKTNELRGECAWLPFISRAVQQLGWMRPGDARDILVATGDPSRGIPHPPDPTRQAGQPRVFTGPIASSGTLLKNPWKRDELRDTFGVKAVEMEASGVADATWTHGAGYLVVRGICDYCDANKNDDWQRYAAIIAAAYARALLESMPPLQWRIQPPVPQPPQRVSAPPIFILPQRDVSTFTGRKDELHRLQHWLIDEQEPGQPRVAAITGNPGMGKSALASHFAEQLKSRFPDGVIGLRVGGKDAATIAREFARTCKEEIAPDEERDPTAIMQEIFRHRRMLLLFDNADAGQLELARVLPGGDRCAVICTMRDRGLPVALDIPDDRVIDLLALPEREAIELLRKHLGVVRVDAEIPAAKAIAEQVGQLPLALHIIGGLLRRRTYKRLVDYARDLHNEQERLSRLVMPGKGMEEISVRSSINLSLQELTAEQAILGEVFACLGVCAEDGFAVHTAAAVTEQGEATEELLNELYLLSLLNRQQGQDNRYLYHPLIRLYAREMAEQQGRLEPAAERHARHLQRFVKSGDATATAVAADLDDIVLAAKWLQRYDEADIEFAIRLQAFFEQHGHWQEALDIIEGFQVLAERIEDWVMAVQFRIQHVKFLTLCGDFLAALHIMEPMQQIIDRIDDPVRGDRCRAMALNSLGGVLQRLGRFEEAVDAFQRSRAIAEELGDKRHLAMVLNSLGGVWQRLGRFEEAVDAFQRSRAIAEELGDQRSLAMVLNSLGGVLQRLGRFEEAVDAFQRSHDLLVKQGDSRGQAMVLNSLGGVLQRLGRFEEAVEVFRKSAAIEEELGNRRGLAMVLNSLGGVSQRLGRLQEAIKALRASAAIEDSLGNRRGQAMVATALGKALLSQGQPEEAVAALTRAFDIEEALRNRRGLEIVLPALVRALEACHRRDDAQACCRRAVAAAPGSRKLQQVLDSLASPDDPGGNHVVDGIIKRLLTHAQGYRYGFITQLDGGADIYFREPYIAPAMIDQLREGSAVTVEVEFDALSRPRARSIAFK